MACGGKSDNVQPHGSPDNRNSCLSDKRSSSPNAAAAAGAVGVPVSAAPPACKPRCAPFSRLRVEKIEGGLMVAGFVVAANCQIVLPIFGFMFMLVGCVLTAASYRGCDPDEQPEHYAARVAFTGNSRVLGPVCIVAGGIMTLAGVVLCVLMRAAQRRQKRLAFTCPVHGDFYPLSPETSRKHSEANSVAGSRGSGGRAEGGARRVRALRRWLGLEGARPPPAAPRCPHEGPCPPPLPFLVPSDSVVGLGSVTGVPLSPEQTFGSMRSLSVSREVASFPMSRTPSPPPMRDAATEEEKSILRENSLPNVIPTRPTFDCGSPTCAFRVVECKMTTTDKLVNAMSSTRNSKCSTYDNNASIEINMPDEEKG